MNAVFLNITSIAAALKGEVVGPNQALVPGPGHSPQDRSLSIKVEPSAPDGFVLHSFANDDFRVCREYVRAAIAAQDDQPIPTAATQNETLWSEAAIRIWEHASNPQGTLVEKYLNNRGLELPPNSSGVIRFHERCPFGKNNYLPCMVGLYRDVNTDEAKAILRTALTEDGKKVSRKVLGPKAGCAIKLMPISGGQLTIGEGLETTLSGIARGFYPAWAVGDAGALAKFPIVGSITKLQILVDNDENGVGFKSALECSQRWTAAGMEVWRIVPETIGHDMADVIPGRFTQ